MKESNKSTPRPRMRIIWTGEHCYLLGAGGGDFRMEQLAFESGYRVSILSQLAGCDGGYLKEVFLRDMGILPKRWLSELRMVVARRMLRGLRRPPEVAKLLGFGSASNFAREFAIYYQISPGTFEFATYRKSCFSSSDLTVIHIRKIAEKDHARAS